jgi:nucleoside-diphosphate-sugar epimerase
MSANYLNEIRQDCLKACEYQPDVRNSLKAKHIAVTGGTGFFGTWIAEMMCALNDVYSIGLKLDLYARDIGAWQKKYPHLANRADIRLFSQDIRSPFQFSEQTNFVVHAAGIPNNRVHASDPLRVYQTTTNGIANALDAAAKLDDLVRFINISSCLANGTPSRGDTTEADCFAMPSAALHNVYAEAKRSAEMLSTIYRSQFRLPISTIRPFTVVGPYQQLDSPWAINSFMRDTLTGNKIRIHGDGATRRSYLYGSDVAWWTFATLIQGKDAHVYNLGSADPISHADLVEMICQQSKQQPEVIFNTLPSQAKKQDDLFPNTAYTEQLLGVKQTCKLEQAVDKTYRWLATSLA